MTIPSSIYKYVRDNLSDFTCPENNHDTLCLSQKQYKNLNKYLWQFAEKHNRLDDLLNPGWMPLNTGKETSYLPAPKETTVSFWKYFQYRGLDKQTYDETVACRASLTEPSQPLWECDWSSKTKKNGVEIDSKKIPLDLDGSSLIPQDKVPFELLPNPQITTIKFLAGTAGALTFAALAVRETLKWLNQKERNELLPDPVEKSSGWFALGYAGISVALAGYAYAQNQILKA